MDIEGKEYRHYAGTSLVVAKAVGTYLFLSKAQIRAFS
jgi:hypothetical protein